MQPRLLSGAGDKKEDDEENEASKYYKYHGKCLFT